MTVTVPLGFRISWYSAALFSRFPGHHTGRPHWADVQVATRTFSSCPFLAFEALPGCLIQLVGLKLPETREHNGSRSAALSRTHRLGRAGTCQALLQGHPGHPCLLAVLHQGPSQHFSQGPPGSHPCLSCSLSLYELLSSTSLPGVLACSPTMVSACFLPLQEVPHSGGFNLNTDPSTSAHS